MYVDFTNSAVPIDDELIHIYTSSDETTEVASMESSNPPVEFDYEGDEDDIPEMMKLYEKIMNGLAKIAVAQPGQKPAVDSPSEKQFEIMDKYGIKYDPKTITKKEAQRLINESINK